MERLWLDYDHCFVCEGPRAIVDEVPGEWIIRRVACRNHRAEAVLPNGEPVLEYVDRRTDDADPFEGSGLNFVINPAEIEGQRVWLDFYMGGPSMVEEVFPSETYYEHLMQHHDGYLDALYTLYSKQPSARGWPAPLRRAFNFNRELSLIVETLWLQRNIIDELRKSGESFPCDPDQAVEVLDKASPTGFRLPWASWVFTGVEHELLGLCHRRFHHLRSVA